MTAIRPGCVSICIPSRNRREMVLRAVQSALQQSYSHVQVIVSDNASEDGSADALTALIVDPRFQLIRQTENIGLVNNLNTVLHAAEGEFFILLSDDDVLCPTAIELLLHPFLHGACGLPPDQIGLTWCPCTVIDATGKAKYDTAAGPECESATDFMHGLYSGTRGPRLSSVLIRTQDAWRAGSYDEARHGALCDSGTWGIVALRYPQVACIPQPLVQYTVLAISETSQAQCKEWQRWGHVMLDDHVAILLAQGDEKSARKLVSSRNALLANLTTSLLLRRIGRPGWVKEVLSEVWRSREFMLTPYVAKRILRDGWKLLRG